MVSPTLRHTCQLDPFDQIPPDLEERFQRLFRNGFAFGRVDIQEADERFEQPFRVVPAPFKLVRPYRHELLGRLANRLFSVSQSASEHSLALLERERLWWDLGENVCKCESSVRRVDVQGAAEQGGQSFRRRDQVEQSSSANLAAEGAGERTRGCDQARWDSRSRVMIEHVNEHLGDAPLGIFRDAAVAVVLVGIAVLDFFVRTLQFRQGNHGVLPNRGLLVTHTLEQCGFERLV